jgi:hygromycin-B 7''-O-kinase
MSPLVPQKYSERLGVIEPDQLEAVAERFGLGRPMHAEPATSEPLGQNVFLDTTAGSFVLRGNPYGYVQLTKERHVARFLHDRSSLAVPWPYEVCDDPSLFGWTYAVMPRLPGEPGGPLWAAQDEDGRLELAEATGDALAMLHEAESAFFGPYDGQLDAFIELDDHTDWFLHRLEHRRTTCRSVNALSTEAERYIDALIERCADALREPFTPVLVHHAFAFENLNFDENGDPSGVFGLSRASLGDGEQDVVRMLRTVDGPDERGAFRDAYTDGEGLPAGSSERLSLYALADWLEAWEHGSRLGWFEGAAFMERTVPIVEAARALGAPP